ncbi:MAG: tRNA (adenosine(37)-N6)-threonylcarbamoyltransferase complex ATPase subunit type 1 TsaE [Candidatus Stygibacter australis]|nr:tRNA (adenosine(37)-N6)-threonylcarbamoyltransferase complex ATPase subunit type 1 TsaE [Candidatus Stygibacter australis]MDP8321666.1 tRNA (adenosine(37)-N6)-threonylcarbamoyltransferase complex ATPase subunit type 1 TsaE [Candidatus Stygibacter australis]
MIQLINLDSQKKTCQLAESIASQVNIGDVLALSGELGAGKTFFTQCFCKHLGVTEYVSSPSYILLNEYLGKFPIAHFDLYRLDSLDEVLETGLPDFIEQRVTIIEWYEVARDLLPENTIYLDFEITETERLVKLKTNRDLMI